MSRRPGEGGIEPLLGNTFVIGPPRVSGSLCWELLGSPHQRGHLRLFGDIFGVGVKEAEQEWVVGCFPAAEELSQCLALTSSPAAGGLGRAPGL